MEDKTNGPSEQDENKRINNNSDDSTTNGLDLLGETMLGVHTSFSSFYSVLHDSMEQKIHMAKQMNCVMEQIFQTNVKVSTKFESRQEGSRLIVTIHNLTGFPITGMTGSIDFKAANMKEDQDQVDSISKVPKWTWVSSSHCTAAGQPTEHNVDSIFLSLNDTATTTNTATNTTVLYPNTKHVEVLCISTSCLTRYNGLIDIQVPLPGGDGSDLIHLTSLFGVYLLDQMKKVINPDTSIQYSNEEQDEGFEREYHGKLIRDVFGINPVLGIEKGMRLCMEPMSGEDELITCRIESTSLDDGNILVRIYGKNKKLVELLVDELDGLKKIV